ncbi:MAG TPA: thioredoxin TrxC [Marinobacterium sp.]|nr:thioredoxin TrxC [Marinobacterium sp.]
MSHTLNLSCPHCMATNRVPADRLEQGPACGKCRKGIFTGTPISLTEETFGKFVRNTDVPVIVDFWAGWCGPCRMMAPAFAEVAKRMEPTVRFAKVDTEAAQELAVKYAIRSLPTLVRFENGKEADRVSGAMNITQIQQWVG